MNLHGTQLPGYDDIWHLTERKIIHGNSFASGVFSHDDFISKTMLKTSPVDSLSQACWEADTQATLVLLLRYST